MSTLEIEPVPISGPSGGLFELERGGKAYEVSNHLGNVLAVVSDLKLGRRVVPNSAGGVDWYEPEVLSLSDYYPFGMEMGGRSFTSSRYRYGFNGQEHDDDFVGQGNGYAFMYRVHDARSGRFLSVDPLAGEYVHYSPYMFAGNKVITSIDREGLEDWDVLQKMYESDCLPCDVINGAANGIEQIIAIAAEYTVPDVSEGAWIRGVLLDMGHIIPPGVSDEELGEAFSLRFSQREKEIVPQTSYKEDLFDFGIAVLDASGVVGGFGKQGAGLLVMSVKPAVKKGVSEVLKSLKISARKKEIRKHIDPDTGRPYREIEAEGAAMFEDASNIPLRPKVLGEKGDFIITGGDYAGKVVDHMGIPNSGLKHFRLEQFNGSITTHFLKEGVDLILLDIRNFSSENISKVMDFVQKNHSENLDRLIILK